MEQSESKPELSAFVAEIAALRDEEVLARKEEDPSKWKSGHFLESDFNPAELTEVDRSIWEKIKDRSITRAEALEYREELKKTPVFLGDFSENLFLIKPL